MANPLKQSIQSAVRANTEIARSFARLGTVEHPRGFVLSAYRNARRALKSAMRERNPARAAQDVMAGLESSLSAQARAEFLAMAGFGREEARRQLGFYGVDISINISNPVELSGQIDSAVTVMQAKIHSQSKLIYALLQTGAGEEQILGDPTSFGVMKASEVTTAAAYWVARLVWAGFEDIILPANLGSRFKKQAIAAIDSRTTECCLRVHGQIQPLGGEFHLTGSPAYAEYMDWAPFHARCRTAVVLYDEVYDDGLTEGMREEAELLPR